MNRGEFGTTGVTEELHDRLFKGILVVIGLALVPSLAFRASVNRRHARDASGAVLPGVTVKPRARPHREDALVVTNGVGQYSIQDLRPGTYSVTFTLPGSARSSATASS
jgi:hypothetical protein